MSATKYKVSTSNGKELRVFLVAPAEYAFFGRKDPEVKSCSSFCLPVVALSPICGIGCPHSANFLFGCIRFCDVAFTNYRLRTVTFRCGKGL